MSKTTEEIKSSRPVSPHLSIYRPQISSVLSIGHRATGACLYFAFVIISWWFALWVFSKFDPFYLKIASSMPACVLLVLTSYAISFHLCTGIRHLIWDTGRMFSIKCVDSSGWVSVILSFVLTALFWLCVL